MRRVAQNCAEAWRRLLCASPVSSSATSVFVFTLIYVWMFEMNRKAITSAQLSEIAPPTAVASVRSRGTLR